MRKNILTRKDYEHISLNLRSNTNHIIQILHRLLTDFCLSKDLREKIETVLEIARDEVSRDIDEILAQLPVTISGSNHGGK
jgi:energy-converting hydrogenase A subunit M